jgi:hypothetical protein
VDKWPAGAIVQNQAQAGHLSTALMMIVILPVYGDALQGLYYILHSLNFSTDRPDETRQFARDGGHGDGQLFAPL